MTTSRNIVLGLGSVWLVGGVGCGPANHPPGASSRAPLEAFEPPKDGSARDRIVLGDLAKVRGTTAADAVRQIRPEFLRAGGRRMSRPTSAATPSVYVNGHYAGEADVLGLIPLRVLIEIRYLDAVAAKTLFGSHCPCDGGAILLRTRL
jgi:hypothetical protein